MGAPCPVFVAGEHQLVLACYVERGRLAQQWATAPIAPEIAGDSDDLCAVVRFARPYAHMFGPPNDEAFSGHPLAARGLSPYAVFEIEESSWLKDSVQMNWSIRITAWKPSRHTSTSSSPFTTAP